jgi:hypothetical protein
MAITDEKTGLFTDILPSGAGFITFGDGRQAFALPSLIRTMDLQLGDEVQCKLAPNFADKATDRVPWRVVRLGILRRAEAPGPVRGIEALTASTYTFLEQRGGAWTAFEISEELGAIETRFVARALAVLFERGRVSRSTLQIGGQAAEPEVFYALELGDLLPLGACEDDEEMEL